MGEEVVRVVPYGEGWAITVSGQEEPLDVTRRKRAALDLGNAFARDRGARIVVHRRDGTFQLSHSYAAGSHYSRYWINHSSEQLRI